MRRLQKLFRGLADRSGATAIEYAIIAGIICIAIVGGASMLGQSANNSYVAVKNGVWGE